jgi:adenylate cyclase class IV
LRITNKEVELVLKYGKWSGNDARKEFLIPIDSNKFEEMIELLLILGFYYGVLQATKTHLYLYKGIEFALVKVPGWGYYFEAEIVTNSNGIKKADKKIDEECKKLDISVLNDRDFCKLLKDLNNRPGFRFNFKKQDFSEIKKRFISYF